MVIPQNTPPILSQKGNLIKACDFDNERLKINDKVGDPILIGVILVWKISNTFKAAFDIDDYESFVRIQSDATVRVLAGSYPYDNFDDDQSVT